MRETELIVLFLENRLISVCGEAKFNEWLISSLILVCNYSRIHNLVMC